MSQTSICEAAVSEQHDELTNLVVKGLTSHGVHADLTRLDDECRLSIPCPGARCTLTIEDGWLATWEWRPAAGRTADPKLLADLACTLLTGQAREQSHQGDGNRRQKVKLKGIVGRELATRGLKVNLEVSEDPVFFEAHTAIVVTSPANARDAEVRVTDDGSLVWERNCWDQAATAEEPEHDERLADPEKLAADIVATVSKAVSLVLASQPSQR